MFTTSPGTNYMLQLDAANQPTSFTTQAGTGAWPYWGNPFGMTLDTDNFHVLVPGLVDPNAGTWALALLGSRGRTGGEHPVAGASQCLVRDQLVQLDARFRRQPGDHRHHRIGAEDRGV